MSGDGSLAIVIIAMQGNPFSPAYYAARQRGSGANPLDFASMHVAVYGRRGTAFALDERRIGAGARRPDRLSIGASSIRWEGDRLVIELDERTTPAPRYNPLRRPVRGRVVLHPEAFTERELAIDEDGLHRWWPISPLAQLEVELEAPKLRFRGHAYHDANAGAVALDETFDSWSWLRARAGNEACITYDVRDASGALRAHAFRVDGAGAVTDLEETWRAPLPRGFWGVPRHARVDQQRPVKVIRSLEDGPFYTRALVETQIGGRPALTVHETLAASRLRSPVVRFMASYRMRESK